MKKSLKGKKVLITAGPTWVALDRVRVLSNISSGDLGRMLCEEAARAGAKVDVLLGPVGPVVFHRRINAIRFKYFHELSRLVSRRLKTNKYDVIFHAAAVSDFTIQPKPGKISSNGPELILGLRRSPKIISKIRRMNSHALLVMFKLESGVKESTLRHRAEQSRLKNRADIVVANTVDNGRYKAFILNGSGLIAKCVSKKALARNLVDVCAEKIRR